MSMPAHRITLSSADNTDLILITNDDGIASPGLRAAVQAALPLGEILVVAPSRQWSGAGRSMPHDVSGHISLYPLQLDGRSVTAHQVDASPALAVVQAVLTLAPRRPALLISGVNYGENLGSDVTASGTVGAALQGAVFGIPALTLSLQTPKETHINLSDDVDFTTAIHFTRLFAKWMLQVSFPFDVDVLKVDIPTEASPQTPWRLTRVSRQAYFVPSSTHGTDLEDEAFPLVTPEDFTRLDYGELPHPERAEQDSDIYALAIDRVVSVAPLSLDMTSRVDLAEMDALLRGRAML